MSTHTLTSYPTYRPSGVSWLGDVPEHWEFRRIKTLFRESDERKGHRDFTLFSLTRRNGLIPQSENPAKSLAAEDLSQYKVCRPTDIVMNRMQAWSGMFGVPTYEGIVSPDYSVFRPMAVCEIGFYKSLFRTPLMIERFGVHSKGIGSGFNRLYSDDFGAIAIPVPPLPEQQAIVRYLDHVDANIRRYVEAKRKLIDLLEEERQAVINQAVTRGLDPDVRLKPSGVEWLGDVPEHWEIRRLKTLSSMKSGEGITAESIEPTGDYPVYGGNGMRGYASNYTHNGEFALIGRQGALCGNVHVARGQFWASEHAVVATLVDGYEIDWFGAILTSMNLNQYSIAAAQPGLAVERILNLYLPVPSSQEQRDIAHYIATTSAGIDSSIKCARRQIELIEEYRPRLVSDVVTGKVDVREAAAQLPDQSPD